jgi:hypothetical protein
MRLPPHARGDELARKRMAKVDDPLGALGAFVDIGDERKAHEIAAGVRAVRSAREK